MIEAEEKNVARLQERLKELSNTQIGIVKNIIEQFLSPYKETFRKLESDLISEAILTDFGDTLRIHHIFSDEPFTKDKFEYAIVRVLSNAGINAVLANKGNPGNDILIEAVPFSLKTQADKKIKRKQVHISKFMELGKGKWGDDPNDLIGLRDAFFQHMKGYDRILTLRCLYRNERLWEYQLVEIPKELLLEANEGQLMQSPKSKQYPKPGHCRVFDNKGRLKFQLYFDGGSERKLQIQKINIDYCIIHASWKFEVYDELEILD